MAQATTHTAETQDEEARNYLLMGRCPHCCGTGTQAADQVAGQDAVACWWCDGTGKDTTMDAPVMDALVANTMADDDDFPF